jgi:hypothetical protein
LKEPAHRQGADRDPRGCACASVQVRDPDQGGSLVRRRGENLPAITLERKQVDALLGRMTLSSDKTHFLPAAGAWLLAPRQA